jgi:hypothetical protein
VCIFLRLFWYLDPSVLTTLSVIGLIATLVDYLVPTLTASICHPENWTGIKERKLEEICRVLASAQTQAACKWAVFYDMRHSRPKMVGSNHFSCLECSEQMFSTLRSVLWNVIFLFFTTWWISSFKEFTSYHNRLVYRTRVCIYSITYVGMVTGISVLCVIILLPQFSRFFNPKFVSATCL